MTCDRPTATIIPANYVTHVEKLLVEQLSCKLQQKRVIMDHDILRAALEGHNILILGQPGTGKTYTLKEIAKTLRGQKQNVQMTASTGLAAAALQGTTVHAFFGIKDGRYGNEDIAAKIQNDIDFKAVKDGILRTDTLIIDEISMLSQKIFHQIDFICRKIHGKPQPFGGAQMILGGDFYQLKPVPNANFYDPGYILITDSEFKTLIPHHFILDKVHRQSESKFVDNNVFKFKCGQHITSFMLLHLQ